MAAEVIVTDEAFPYLVAQRGALDGLKGDRQAWESAYRADLAETFEDIRDHLPGSCAAVLDVGGGMGGIDVLVARRFGEPQVEILDGLAAGTVVRRHDAPFSDASVAGRFLAANGVRRFRAVGPEETRRAGPIEGGRVDLVLSFAAWCFHIPPADYLPYVWGRCHPETVAILDVRKDRRDWHADLACAFRPLAVLREAAKFMRVAFAPC